MDAGRIQHCTISVGISRGLHRVEEFRARNRNATGQAQWKGVDKSRAFLRSSFEYSCFQTHGSQSGEDDSRFRSVEQTDDLTGNRSDPESRCHFRIDHEEVGKPISYARFQSAGGSLHG